MAQRETAGSDLELSSQFSLPPPLSEAGRRGGGGGGGQGGGVSLVAGTSGHV